MRLIPQVDSVIQKILSYLRVAFCCCRKQVVIPQGEVQNPVAAKRGSIFKRASVTILKGVVTNIDDSLDGGINTNNNNVISDVVLIEEERAKMEKQNTSVFVMVNEQAIIMGK